MASWQEFERLKAGFAPKPQPAKLTYHEKKDLVAYRVWIFSTINRNLILDAAPIPWSLGTG